MVASSQPSTRHVNRYALLTESQVDKIKKRVAKINDLLLNDLTDEERKIWDVLNQANALAQKICSSDLPSDAEATKDIVGVVQQEEERILADDKLSWLEKIVKIVQFVVSLEAGNCQEKAYFGFLSMLHNLTKYGLTYEEKPVSLKLAYFDNHFVVIVADRFFMDPWLNLAFPLSPGKGEIREVFNGFGELRDYFSIDSNNRCFTHEIMEKRHMPTAIDKLSGAKLNACLKQLDNQHNDFGVSPPAEMQQKTGSAKRKKTAKKEEEPQEDAAPIQEAAHLTNTTASSFYITQEKRRKALVEPNQKETAVTNKDQKAEASNVYQEQAEGGDQLINASPYSSKG